MAKKSVKQTEAMNAPEGNYSFRLAVGADAVLQVRGGSAYDDRQDIASCLLDVVVDLAQERFEDDDRTNQQRDWAIAHLASVAKGLLDSMDLKGIKT